MAILVPCILAAQVLTATPQAAPAPPTATPRSSTLAGDATPPDVSEALETIRVRHDLPGLVVLGLCDGETGVQGVCGKRAVEDPAPLTLADKFHLGSCAKAITSTMIAALVEAGDLSWDLTLREAVPDLASSMHESFHEVTLLQLLQHRGGIAERKDRRLGTMLLELTPELDGDATEQRWEFLAEVLSTRAIGEVGGRHDYSNYGYMAAALMAETVMDQPYRELMQEYVFEPLDMRSAGFRLPGSVDEVDQPRGHRPGDEGWASIPPRFEEDLPECIAPAGLVHCTLQDWARFIQDHLNGGRGQDGLVTAEQYTILQTPLPGDSYACGWVVQKRGWSPGGPAYFHNGSNGAWHSVVWMSPSRNVAAMAVTNCFNSAAAGALDEAVVLAFQTMGVLPATVGSVPGNGSGDQEPRSSGRDRR